MRTKYAFRLPDELEPTRATLHRYARVLGAVALAHGKPHPKYWHMSLKVEDIAFASDRFRLPDGRYFQLKMDFDVHAVILDHGDGSVQSFDMTAGDTGTQFGDRIVAAVSALGVDADYEREEFESDEPRLYQRDIAAGFHGTIAAVNEVFEAFRSEMKGERGPVQLWPHGFDIAFEWFGVDESQINVGFYPAGNAYFYSNPWPFDSALLGTSLPHGAQWYTDGWEGSKLDYNLLRDDAAWADKVMEYARAVHAAAAPALSK